MNWRDEKHSELLSGNRKEVNKLQKNVEEYCSWTEHCPLKYPYVSIRVQDVTSKIIIILVSERNF